MGFISMILSIFKNILLGLVLWDLFHDYGDFFFGTFINM